MFVPGDEMEPAVTVILEAGVRRVGRFERQAALFTRRRERMYPH